MTREAPLRAWNTMWVARMSEDRGVFLGVTYRSPLTLWRHLQLMYNGS